MIDFPHPIRFGSIQAARGLTADVAGLDLMLGGFCRLADPWTGPFAQVIGFQRQHATIMPLEQQIPFAPGMRVFAPNSLDTTGLLPVGDALLGRILDPMGRPLDGRPAPIAPTASITPTSSNPMLKTRIQTTLDVGVRAINALLSIGVGQRLGIFAGSGVGKSTLLSMLSKYTQVDMVVIALIGERSREVREFIDESLGPQGLSKSVVIVASAGATPLMKMQGAEYACRIAEHAREQGQRCLLIMDSLTRYAMAAREVGLAAGEPPATKGYPPSVFSKINTLVERAGTGETANGSITALYTVLSEGDDLQDPVADNARAILDGHIVLSRLLADQGHYPPIDIPASASRALSAIASPSQLARIRKFKQLLSIYAQNRDLINVGAYQRGTDPLIDQSMDMQPRLSAFLQQSATTGCSLDSSLADLHALFPDATL